MNLRTRYNFTIIIALLLILVIANVGAIAARVAVATEPSPPDPPPPIKAILKTGDNRPISVNGANAITGATILTGSIIETPDQVGGVISLGSLGDLQIEPNTRLRLDFDANGNMKVTLVRGCATARTKKNIIAEIDTSQGVAGTTDHKSRKNLTVCFPLGAAAPTVSIPAGAAAASNAVLDIVAIGIVAGGLPLGLRGTNPSPSGP